MLRSRGNSPEGRETRNFTQRRKADARHAKRRRAEGLLFDSDSPPIACLASALRALRKIRSLSAVSRRSPPSLATVSLSTNDLPRQRRALCCPRWVTLKRVVRVLTRARFQAFSWRFFADICPSQKSRTRRLCSYGRRGRSAPRAQRSGSTSPQENLCRGPTAFLRSRALTAPRCRTRRSRAPASRPAS